MDWPHSPGPRGGRDVNPSAGCVLEALARVVQYASSPEVNSQLFSTQPFLPSSQTNFSQTLYLTYIQLHTHLPCPTTFSQQNRQHGQSRCGVTKQPLPLREQLANILSQQSSLVPLVVSDRSVPYNQSSQQHHLTNTPSQPLSLLLKACPLVDKLSLYDVVNTPGVATDLSHISSIAQIEGFLPADDGMRKAFTGADIVIIPAGIPRKPPAIMVSHSTTRNKS
jgi:hypothetical protein